ncbi:hypothetical protein K502DRAFT_366531 [Neoconidiobolus thromboides FSU 785]|nr:hypothetical protein K502DRAFT_366531 [Neoconidiobolus thromboides FSU 785]
MKSTLNLLSLLYFAIVVQAQNPITFTGSPLATSSISSQGTVLYSTPGTGQTSGAQFLYQKNISDSKQVGLAEVHLVSNNGIDVVLQTGFDTITQECSCYYIDAKDLIQKIPNLRSANDYRISFIGTNYRIDSGYFAISIQGSVSDGAQGFAPSGGAFNSNSYNMLVQDNECEEENGYNTQAYNY